MTYDRTKPVWLAAWGLETPETEGEREDRLRKERERKEFLERCADEWAAAGASSEDSLIGDHKAVLEDGTK